jgi:multiple sugar transport system ATP-binding protein
VIAVEHLGGETYIYLERAGADPLVVKADGNSQTKVDEVLPVGVPASACYLFDEDGQAFPRAA